LEHQNSQISFIKAFFISIAVIAVIVGIVLLSSVVLRLNFLWVTFLYPAICASMGLSFNKLEDTTKIYIGCGVGLITGFLLSWAPETFEIWGYAIPGIIIFAMIVSMTMQKLSYIFNGGTALVMTILAAGASVHLSALVDLTLAFVLFGIIPFGLSKFSKKGNA